MNSVTRVLCSAFLLALALLVGIALARQNSPMAMAGSSRPPFEFTGPITEMPATLWGTWRVGATPVEVSPQTSLDEGKEAFRVGTWVQVRAQEGPIGLQALAIRALRNVPASMSVELRGPVTKVSPGLWVIAGRQVLVNATTRVVGDVATPQGAVATVKAHWEGTSLVADEIRLTTPAEAARTVEFVGRLEAVRDSVWVVDGVEVLRPEGVAEPPPLGSLVSVSGEVVGERRVRPQRLAVEAVPTTSLEGWVLSAGDPERGWEVLVDGDTPRTARHLWVEVPTNTPIDEREGPVRPGARIALRGISQEDERFVARFVRVVDAEPEYLTGVLTYIPEDPYAYPWTVDETRVWVRPTTVTDRPLGEFRLGDRVAVTGWRRSDGSLIAYMLSLSKR